MRTSFVLPALSLLCAASPGLAQEPPAPRPLVEVATTDKRLAGYTAAEGVKVEVVPIEPAPVNPHALTFLDDGTPLLVERPAKGVHILKALSVKDAAWGRASVLLEADCISDVLPYDGRLYVAGSGGVRQFRPARDGEPREVPAVLVSGFGGFPDGLRLRLGPDGWLYVSAPTGDHQPRGTDGSRARAVGTGAVFRFRPDGSRVETFAVGLAGSAGVTFDPAGQAFVTDGRLLHLAEGGDYRRLSPLLPAGKLTPGGLVVTHRSPDGTVGLLHPDARRRVVQAIKLAPAGASFKVVEESAFLAAPKDAFFSPGRLTAGPDGAMYLVDRRDGKQGRVLRIRHADAPARAGDAWSKFATLKDEELVRALSGDDAGDRERARRELVKRGDKNRAALIRLLDSDDTSLAGRLGAMGALQAMANDDVLAALARTLADGPAEAQRFAADLLGVHARKDNRAVADALTKALATEDRAVRRAVAMSLGRLGSPGAADTLAAALSFDDGADAVMRDGLARAVERLGKAGIDALLSLANSGVQKDSDRVLEVFLTFRTRPAFDAIVKLLQNPHLSVAQRADLVRSSGHYRLDPPASLDPIVAHVLANGRDATAVVKALAQALATPGVTRGPKGEAFLKERKGHPEKP